MVYLPSQTDFLSLFYDNYRRGVVFIYFLYFNLIFVEDRNKYIFNNISCAPVRTISSFV